ncbi:aldo/keto reductase [Lutimaribacter sp. EGI FJ00015]|uniref:Aldo/keto reductase n=1 Tax=Lutimaribacter degradans TaxID=2945989 RepID=A0ACC5ZRN0_9RHOB|nr:aldo/keto reductase [Lutimaribacter sp. EGI FJ00013]MCM2560742.1 aldo/keto reductase [Lutimaribacter sp. EGI FJ00013]MCO0612312.1 aldo/keto reductase [Lutimaribacter sp. EGI FJ00015]MCO0634567.1 aldo/keto reductase [Lutimaribacter sp. EGI FJ00014]
MKKNPLGRTGLMVSELCLGTMTFGTQTPEPEAHAQIDRALEAGINFVDTAEMYPVNPVSPETVGLTEEIIGDWIAANPGRRGDIVLATKHPGEGSAIRPGGTPLISSDTIAASVEGSLRRLKTGVIDLYQFHWPNRGSYQFRRNWSYDPSGQDRAATITHMEDCMEALSRQVEKGNIRHFGLSNESAWGTTRWCDVADRLGGPRPASIQNEYSLLCRLFDTDLAEVAVNEDVGLLAFSPLGAGFLTGKYQGGDVPDASRMSLNPEMGGRKSERVFNAVQAYLELAREHGIDPVHMALAWAAGRPFMTSVIFGATTLAQLDHALAAADVRLDDDLRQSIDDVHRAHPMPF